MAVDKVKVKAVFRELRTLFKGQHKAGNKAYVSNVASLPSTMQPRLKPGVQHWRIVPDEKQRAQRNALAADAAAMIQAHRSFFAESDLSLLAYGHLVLDQAWLCGNCIDMAAAACYLVRLRQAGTPWLVRLRPPGDHAFCFVSGSLGPTKQLVFDYAFDPSDAWVIDAWANVCCPVQDYEDAFAAQMQRWAGMGKFVIVGLDDGITNVGVDPGARDYIEKFTFAGLEYYKVDGALPLRLPRAIRERKDGHLPALPGGDSD